MDVKTLCLGVLTHGEASGYDIKKYFECTFSHFFVAGFGSIYPALAELTRQGLVTCREESEGSRPDRKVYALTENGRAHFLKELANTPPNHKVRSEFFVLLHFAHLLTPEKLDGAVDERIGQITQDLNYLENIREKAAQGECKLPAGPSYAIGMVIEQLKVARKYMIEHRHTLSTTGLESKSA